MSTARNPLAGVSLISTPQSRPLPGRKDMVKNAAGGYVFGKGLWTKTEDFMILGTTGGTFYTSEAKLTDENLTWLMAALDEDPLRFVTLIRDISVSQPSRAPKADPCLFALALAESLPEARGYVKLVFSDVVRTTDHLAKFFGYAKNLGGKPSKSGHGTSPVMSRSRRTTLASWFNNGDIHDVTFRALKGRQRKTPSGESMELKDIIRIAHVAGTDAGAPGAGRLARWTPGGQLRPSGPAGRGQLPRRAGGEDSGRGDQPDHRAAGAVGVHPVGSAYR